MNSNDPNMNDFFNQVFGMLGGMNGSGQQNNAQNQPSDPFGGINPLDFLGGLAGMSGGNMGAGQGAGQAGSVNFMEILEALMGEMGNTDGSGTGRNPISEEEVRKFSEKLNSEEDLNVEDILADPSVQEYLKNMKRGTTGETDEEARESAKKAHPSSQKPAAKTAPVKGADFVTNARVIRNKETDTVRVEVGLIGIPREDVENVSLDTKGRIVLVVKKDGETLDPIVINLGLKDEVFVKEGSSSTLENGLLTVTLNKTSRSFDIPLEG